MAVDLDLVTGDALDSVMDMDIEDIISTKNLFPRKATIR